MPDLTPTYVTIDPVTGLASAIFPGGVTIDAVFEDININPIGPSGNVVKWIKQSDGSAIAQIGAAQQVDIADQAPELKLVAIDPNSLQAAQIFLRSGKNPNPARVEVAVSNGNGYTRRIIDSDGNSDLVGVSPRSQCVVNFGSSTLTWGGASATSNTLAISHGLKNYLNVNTPPTAVIACGNTSLISAATFTFTSTQFSANATRVDGAIPGAGTTAVIFWIACARV